MAGPTTTSLSDLGYGTDVSTFKPNEDGRPDLDPNFGTISGPRVVLEAVARSWLALRGTIAADPSIGCGLRNYLSAKFTDSAASLDTLRGELVLEALRDPRVEDITVSIALDREAETLTITGTITLADTGQRFDYVLTIDRVTTDLVLGRVT